MARFVLTRRCPLPPDECWARLTAWPRHGDRVPFTRVRAVRGSGREAGDVVLARTSLGPLHFDDPMEIVALGAPGDGRPGTCRLEKRGRVVRGHAELRVRAVGAGSEAVWAEELRIAGLPRLLDPLVAAAARVVFGRVLDHLLAADVHAAR
ncbi:SRPBCC family protein [Streptomyces sp. SP17BM10]|uniref:SRPBCC family protein n=1 Tax=Streptomyces sp. SP17BM10 TaxID=3002530 RepID=UPI002E77E1AD|nr:SRPBCC family protein [Streptomyces sp. SP17BM10]MEE1783116.1 SRPBCC family protein [Streptomyces sp. SP17BM10]